MRPSWLIRLALRLVPQDWRAAVAYDLAAEAGIGAVSQLSTAARAIGVGLALHWTFTRAALWDEIRFAIRSIRRAPAFAAGAIATFALGVGVNVAVYSAVDRMLFRPLPYGQADRLVVMGLYPAGDSRAYGTVPALYGVGLHESSLVDGITDTDWDLDSYRATADPDATASLGFVPMSPGALRTLGVHPILGRDFTRADAGAMPRRVLLAYRAWQRAFGARSDIVGLRLFGAGGRDAEVVGVLPGDFIPPQVDFPQAWDGISVNEDTFEHAGPRDLVTPPIIRLKPGVTIGAAEAQARAIAAAIDPQIGRSRTAELRLVPLRDALFGRYRLYIALVFTAASLVLLVGCANLASLLLVRARSREHRTAVQLSLGASTARVMQAALVEAAVLAGAGGMLALGVLKLTDRALLTWLPSTFSRYAASVLEWRVLLFAAAVAAIAALVAGVLPGWRAARVDVIAVLQRGTARAGSGRLRGTSALVALEIALSTVLVSGATLTSATLVRLLHADVGFDPRQLFNVTAYLPPSSDSAELLRRYRETLAVVRATPGVRMAAGADVLPIIGAVGNAFFEGDRARRYRFAITEDFFETMRTPVVAGRSFSAADVAENRSVGVLSESGLASVWPGLAPGQAVGRQLTFPNEAPREVVGIVADVRFPYTAVPNPSLYVPLSAARFRRMMLLVRGGGSPMPTEAALARRLRDAGFPIARVTTRPIAENFEASVADERFRAQLLTAFAVVALVLAAIGIYAVQSFVTMLRQSEFGIRMSLGATSANIRRMLIVDALRPALVGVAFGLVGTWWAGRFLQTFLVGGDARDPRTFVAVAVLLLAAAVAAVWLPARRAERTDPAIVLRAQ